MVHAFYPALGRHRLESHCKCKPSLVYSASSRQPRLCSETLLSSNIGRMKLSIIPALSESSKYHSTVALHGSHAHATVHPAAPFPHTCAYVWPPPTPLLPASEVFWGLLSTSEASPQALTRTLMFSAPRVLLVLFFFKLEVKPRAF